MFKAICLSTLAAAFSAACMARTEATPAQAEAAPLDTEPAPATLFGAAFSPRTPARQADVAQTLGPLEVIRSFDNGKGASTFPRMQASDASAASAYSFKYLPSEILAGAHDDELKAFFRGIADGHRVYWTYWHEPDDEIFKTSTFTAADYRAAWAAIRRIADGEKLARPGLQAFATFIAMEYSMRPSIAPSRPLLGDDGMYPGDDVIDVFGVDAYNTLAPKGGVMTPETQFGKVIAFAKDHHKPWSIGEIGSCVVAGDLAGRARYLHAAIAYWRDSGYPPVYAAYFDNDTAECDYRLDRDPAAAREWAAASGR